MKKLFSQDDLAGDQIHIRRKKDGDRTYYKAFIPGAFITFLDDLEGCGATPLAAILSVAQQIANLAPSEGTAELMEREEYYANRERA